MVHGAETLLLAAVGGYWVLERAEAHKGNLKKVGQFLGWLIIVASLMGVACRVWSFAASCPIGMMGKGRTCPLGFKSTTASSPTP